MQATQCHVLPPPPSPMTCERRTRWKMATQRSSHCRNPEPDAHGFRRSQELFSFLRTHLLGDPSTAPHVIDIRGKGLMVDVEFANPEGNIALNGGGASTPKNISSRFATQCIEKGMFILTTSAFEVIRFIPSLNI
jgi:acetylornithine/succinyldiaminopimelate/putrescine aminotransferase